jgi:hypothetical protein
VVVTIVLVQIVTVFPMEMLNQILVKSVVDMVVVVIVLFMLVV